jgi:hypothetical protein
MCAAVANGYVLLAERPVNHTFNITLKISSIIMIVKRVGYQEREIVLLQSPARYASGRAVKPRNAAATAPIDTLTKYLFNTSHTLSLAGVA